MKESVQIVFDLASYNICQHLLYVKRKKLSRKEKVVNDTGLLVGYQILTL